MKRKFYKIRKSWEPRVIGVKDGMAQAELIKDKFQNKSNYTDYSDYFLNFDRDNYLSITKFPSFRINLEYLELRRDAKLTDFVWFAPGISHNVLISKKVQELLKKFTIPPYELYNASLHDGAKIISDYKFFYCPSFNFDVVEFNLSQFSTGSKKLGKTEVKINSQEELRSFNKPLNRDKIVLKQGFNSQLDYFDLLILSEQVISEDMYNEFQKLKISGLEIFELTDDDFEILN